MTYIFYYLLSLLPEEFPCSTRNNSFIFVGFHPQVIILVLMTSQHRMSLSTTCLSVRHYTDVIPGKVASRYSQAHETREKFSGLLKTKLSSNFYKFQKIHYTCCMEVNTVMSRKLSSSLLSDNLSCLLGLSILFHKFHSKKIKVTQPSSTALNLTDVPQKIRK